MSNDGLGAINNFIKFVYCEAQKHAVTLQPEINTYA